MVYCEKFVAVIICDGEIVREVRKNGQDVVPLPFGKDYSIRLKNLHSRRAAVTITIDGKDVVDGKKIILDADETTELTGFMDGYTVKNRFRFIRHTKDTKEFRGERIDDGLVRIEWQFEEEYIPPKKVIHEEHITRRYYHDDYWYPPYPPYPPYPRWTRPRRRWNDIYFTDNTSADNCQIKNIGKTSDYFGSVIGDTMSSTNNLSYSSNKSKRAKSKITRDVIDSDSLDDGFTGKGSQTNQEFSRGYVGKLESQKHVIVIQLKGTDEQFKPVKKVVTTRDKLQCVNCGRKSKSSMQFCPNCGSFLER